MLRAQGVLQVQTDEDEFNFEGRQQPKTTNRNANYLLRPVKCSMVL